MPHHRRTWTGAPLAAIVVISGAGCPARRAPESPATSRPDASEFVQQDLPPGAMAFPTGDPVTSLLLVEHLGPSAETQIRAGEPWQYRIRVSNLSAELPLAEIAIHQNLPASFHVLESIPPSAGGGTGAGPQTWRIDQLGPGESTEIRVTGVSDAPGPVASTMHAGFTPVLATSATVLQPRLRVEKHAPGEWSACDLIPVRYIITNTGSAPTAAGTLRDSLPEGLQAPDGTREIAVAVPPLDPGESREETTLVRSTSTGAMTSRAMILLEDGVRAYAAPVTTIVRQPVLDVFAEAPELQHTDSTVRFIFTIINRGNGPAEETRLQIQLDEQTEILGPPGADVGHGVAVLAVGTIAPGEVRQAALTVVRHTPGQIQLTAEALASCVRGYRGERPIATARTDIRGITALEIQVVDTVDPVRLGGEAVYELTVHNRGTAADSNIAVLVQLPEELTLVEAFGTTDAEVQNRTIRFQALHALQPGESAVWYVRTVADRAGDIRVLAEVDSDGLRRPLYAVESTRLY